MKEFSVQHYTFRPLSNEIGMIPMLEKLSRMGYTGVELCCFGGFESLKMDAKELKDRMDDLGLKLVGNHFTREMFRGDHHAAFAYIAEAEGRYAIYNIWGSYDTLADVEDKAAYLNSLSTIAAREGITLLYHNHAHEFVQMDGRLIIDRLDEVLDPAIGFEHDVFFSRQQGCDVYEYLRTHGHRVRTVHLKQLGEGGENVDLPDGMIDMAEVIRSAPYATDYILEQSSFPVSILESLRRNAEYLKTL